MTGGQLFVEKDAEWHSAWVEHFPPHQPQLRGSLARTHCEHSWYTAQECRGTLVIWNNTNQIPNCWNYLPPMCILFFFKVKVASIQIWHYLCPKTPYFNTLKWENVPEFYCPVTIFCLDSENPRSRQSRALTSHIYMFANKDPNRLHVLCTCQADWAGVRTCNTDNIFDDSWLVDNWSRTCRRYVVSFVAILALFPISVAVK